MTDHANTYPDLVNVEDWLNAKGYTGEAGACHQAMSLIRSQEKRIAELEAALKPFSDKADHHLENSHWMDPCFTVEECRAARAALGEKE
jgi:hypothetical protein